MSHDTCLFDLNEATLLYSIPLVGVPILNTDDRSKFSCPLGAPTIRSTPETVRVKLVLTWVRIMSTHKSKLMLMVMLKSVRIAVVFLRFKLSIAMVLSITHAPVLLGPHRLAFLCGLYLGLIHSCCSGGQNNSPWLCRDSRKSWCFHLQRLLAAT